jgi:SPX domain protein involved in polyphosphate accumulation
LKRSEYKYYVPLSALDDMRADMLPYLDYDPYMAKNEKKEYTVRSVYFDSVDLFTYREKQAGLKERMKFRIRAYNETSPDSISFIEIKRKDGDIVWKDRAKILIKNIDEFIATHDFSLLHSTNGSRRQDERSASNFLFYYLTCSLEPLVMVNYEREAFECKFGSGLRVTFDKNIRAHASQSASQLYIEEHMSYVRNNYFVLEIKFDRFIPNWMKSILTKYYLQRSSASKYMMCVDAIHKQIFTNGAVYDRKFAIN